MRVVGQDARGLLYGVAKFLRSSCYAPGEFTPGSWRRRSTPRKPLRGSISPPTSTTIATRPPAGTYNGVYSNWRCGASTSFSCGSACITLTGSTALREALTRALGSGRPALIDVVSDIEATPPRPWPPA